MEAFVEWLSHRSRLVGLETQAHLAEACGISARTLRRIIASGSLEGVNRSVRSWLARALKVPLRDLEALEAGRIDWIDDDRIVDLERLGAGYIRPPAEIEPQPSPATQRGVPIVGRIMAGGRVEISEDWTCEEGPRLPIRYSSVPDAYALKIDAENLRPPYVAGVYLVLRPVDPAQIKAGEEAVVVYGDSDTRSLLGRVEGEEAATLRLVAPAHGTPIIRWSPVTDILRVGRIIATYTLDALLKM